MFFLLNRFYTIKICIDISQIPADQSKGVSFSTTQSIDSFRPCPVFAEHLKIAQSLSFILVRPSTSLSYFSEAASVMSCLFPSTKRGTDLRVYFWNIPIGTYTTLFSSSAALLNLALSLLSTT